MASNISNMTMLNSSLMMNDSSSSIMFANGKKIDSSLVDYVDILFNLMGVDITYSEFQKMTECERKQFLRDIKINKIINE